MDVSMYKIGRDFNLQINRIEFLVPRSSHLCLSGRGGFSPLCGHLLPGWTTRCSTPVVTAVLVRSVCVCSTGGVAVNISYICAPQGGLSSSAPDTELAGSPGVDASSASVSRGFQKGLPSGPCPRAYVVDLLPLRSPGLGLVQLKIQSVWCVLVSY